MQDGVAPETIETFGLLRGPASFLMSLPSIDASNAQATAHNLNAIQRILNAMRDPELHFTKQLIAYTQHALNRILLLCKNFMQPDKRFDFLVEAWCKCLEFLLRLPDGYAFVMGADWRYSQLLFDILFRAVDGLPVRNVQQPPSKRTQRQQTLDPSSMEKDRMPEEARLAALRCLVLALPLDSAAPTAVDFAVTNTDDRAVRTDKDQKVQDHLLDPTSHSTLGQMLVIILSAAKDADLVALRTTALEGVLKLVKCLQTPGRVATWFPGIAAGLAEAMLKRGLKEHHSVLVKALNIWTYLVILLLKDETPSGTQLAEVVAGGSGLAESLMSMYREKGKSRPTSEAQSTTKSTRPAQVGYGSEEWMRKTNHGLKTLFTQITPLRAHSHWLVRLGFGEMAFKILKDCQRSVAQRTGNSKTSSVASFLLETLIGCTQDDYNAVNSPARTHLGELTEDHGSLELTNIGKEILRERLMGLPRVLLGADETTKRNSIRIAQGLILFMGRQMESMVNYQTLLTFVQPWINVLTVDQLDQHNMDERGGILGSGSSSLEDDCGSEQNKWNTWVQSHKGSGRKFGFPRRIHLHLREQMTSIAFMGFLRQIGSTTDISIWTEELTSRLQQDCRSVRENQGWFDAGSVSCVLMMNQLLLGAHGVGLATFGGANMGSVTKASVNDSVRSKKNSLLRKYQRQVRRSAKGILEEYLAVMVECSQMSRDAKLRQEADQRFMPSAEGEARSKRVALAKLFHMEEQEYEVDEPEARIYDYNTDVMLQCMLLEGIATVAVVLGGPEFEMELVRVLYILLEYLGDQDSALVRDTSEATLEHIAFICGYGAIGDLIQANYDYVIQQVSQRIAFLSSNPKTPQVLWSLIRVVGPPAISMLEDSVSEIFEALDHWQNQEDEVAEGLLKSLSEIVKVMVPAPTSPAQPAGAGGDRMEAKRDSGVMMSPGVEFSVREKPSKEVGEFARTYRIMAQGVDAEADAEMLRKETENMTPEQVRDYFLKLAEEAKEDEEKKFGLREDGGSMENEDKEEIEDDDMSFGDLRAKMPKPSQETRQEPPTKRQELCLRILTKAGYFLTASSPRMRILALETIQGAIVVLKDRPQELNPAIHAFWPSIVGRVLKRSDMEVFYVSLRAIEVVTLLAENCSDFLGRHLLDDIWPFIVKALGSWTTKTPAASAVGRRAITRDTAGGNSSRGRNSLNGPSPQRRSQGRREASGKVFTLEHRLQMTTLGSVAKIVRKIRIPVQEAWAMLLLARDMMMDLNWTLHWDVRLAAAEVIRSMAIAGHGDSVFLVMDEFMQRHKRSENGGLQEMVEDEDEDEDAAFKMCKDMLAFLEEENL